MGGRQSSVYDEYPHLTHWRKIFDLLAIQDGDVAQLFNEFSYLPLDAYHTIDTKSLILAIGLDNNAFVQRIFMAFNCQEELESKSINFGEYVTMLWNLSTVGKHDISYFAFDLYDDNCSGEMTPSCVAQMIYDLHPASPGSELQSLVHKLAHMPGAFTVTSFNDYCQKHPAIVTPIIAIQEKVRRTIMGEGFWRRLTKSREQLKCVITLSKLRLLLLQIQRKQTSKNYFRRVSSQFLRSISRKRIHTDTIKVSDDIDDAASPPKA